MKKMLSLFLSAAILTNIFMFSGVNVFASSPLDETEYTDLVQAYSSVNSAEVEKPNIEDLYPNENGFDITISPVEDADGYEVRYATWENFGNAKSNVYEGNDETTFTVTGRAYDAKYYVQVRAYKTVDDEKVYSDWTEAETVNTVSAFPDETSIKSVKANENGFDVTVSKAENATGYEVQYATWDDFGNGKIDTYEGNDKTTFTITGRAYDAKYYVRVRTYKIAFDEKNYSEWSNAETVNTVSAFPDETSIKSVKTNENGFDVTVSKAENATGYEVQYATWENFGNGKIDTYEGNDKTTFTITGRAYDAKYYVRVRTYKTAYGEKNYSEWSKYETVNTVSAIPDKTSITSVKANENGFDVTVSKAENTTGYEVQYATWENFGNGKIDTFEGNDKTTFTITGRAYGTKYYVRVRTYKTVYGEKNYSEWSKYETVTTVSAYPSDVTISSVKTNGNGFDVTLSKASNATGYQIRYATWENFGNAKTDTFAGTDKTTFTITGRAYDTKYYVQARAYKTIGNSTYYSDWSDKKGVYTLKDPSYPNPTAITSVKANENGFDVTVSAISGIDGYEVRYATWENFGNAKTDTFAGTDKTTFTITGRAYDAKYYVQARTYREVGSNKYYSDWSEAKTVTTVSMYPDKISVSSVKANGNGFDVTVSKASNATGYEVQYATWDNFGNGKIDVFEGNEKTTFTITGRAYDAKYYVRVRTYKIVSGTTYYSEWSKDVTVTTEKDPNCPDATEFTKLTGVVNGFELSWKAVAGVSGYEIQYATKSDFSNGASQTADGNATSKTITGRAGGYNYYVRIRAFNTVSGANYYSNWSAAKTVKTISSYVDDLKKAGFPDSYIPALVELHEKYPNWIFKPMITGLDWSTAVKEERSHGKTNPHSQQLIEYWSGNHNKGYYCTCSSCYKNGKYVTYEGGGWVAASQKAVEYYMDPRNFLNEQEIFQFESSEYNGTQTQAGVEAILKGTWMYNSTISYKDENGNTKKINKKYSQVIIDASNKSGLSAYYLASKIRQEVGGSSPTAGGASGTVSGYKGIYNYYNINAYSGANDGLKWASSSAGNYTNCECRVRQSATTSSAELVMLPKGTKVDIKSETSKQSDGYTWYQVSVTYGGKTYNGYIRSDLVALSYGRPWTDPEKSIVNGAVWIANNYKDQPTGYLQKFNVNPASDSLYGHEYMANVQAAAAEARSTYNAYKEANIVGVTKTFSIPVFKNMPNS